MSAADIRRTTVTALAVLLAAFGHAASAAVTVHIVKTDLKPLIHAAVDSPVQFAVLVPHAASTASAGNWSVEGAQATWRYAVAVPTAVSLSFHATQSLLPESATLIVRGAKTATSYRAHDLHRGELWSRIQPGEGLDFTLTVAAEDRDKVAFSIASLQVGYRALGAGVEDHPYYRQLKAQAAAASGNASCVTNYQCRVSAANTPPGAATVGLIIGNLYQCTGSLINDVPGDNTPYVLTARHCESGALGGGSPGAASTVTVYWDATTPCNAALGSLYDPGIATQAGAQTVVEQQDAWLIKLDVNPIVSDAQFAGFDARGGAVMDGYTIHHAEGNDKQFTGWFGQAAVVQQSDVLGTTYLSNFLETVNQTGNIGPGASGSGLFDQNNHLVGSLSLGRQTSDPSGYGACPVANPPAPNGSNGVADFTSLAAVWNSTADTTSTTGRTTLKSVLDPGNSGIVTVPSAPIAFVMFSASNDALSFGQPVTLTWSALSATQCTAGGGVSGDGWSGVLAASGSKSVTETAANLITYTLSCAYAGGRTARASVTVSWLGPSPALQFNAPTTTWIDAPVTLRWTSNVTPCAITGGGLALSNLPASGSTTTTQATAADVGYNLTCGPPNQTGSYPLTVAYVTPSLVFNANGTDRRLGVTFFLVWSTAADSCTPSGGAPNDGWATTEFTGFYATSGEPFYPTVTTPGTYIYTLTCSAGPHTVQQSVTVTFENNAPYVTLVLSPSSVTFSASPADWATLTWKTNLAACGFNTTPNLPLSIASNPYLSDGQQIASPSQSGTYQVTAYCNSTLNTGPAAATSTVTLTVLPPPPPVLKITFNPTTVVAGQSFTAAWSATNAVQCTQTGGIPGGSWGATVQFVPPTGSYTQSGAAGQYTFGLSCQSIDPTLGSASTQATLDIGALTATLTTSATSVTNGNSFTLTWSSDGATSCTASGGGANGMPWSGSVGTSGALTQTATANGTFMYTLVCSAGTASTAPQQATINVSAPSGGGSSGGGGHGGGGAIGVLELALLAALRGMRFSAPGRVGRRSPGPWRR